MNPSQSNQHIVVLSSNNMEQNLKMAYGSKQNWFSDQNHQQKAAKNQVMRRDAYSVQDRHLMNAS